MSFLFVHLPKELINHILSYDKHFKIKRGIPKTIIPKDDMRYEVLTKMPIIQNGHVYIKKELARPVYIDVFDYFTNNNQLQHFYWRMIVFNREQGFETYYTSCIR